MIHWTSADRERTISMSMRGATKSRSGRQASRVPGSQLWRAAERSGYEGPLLLDTHIWVWMLEGRADRLAPPLVRLLERAAAHARLVVCDISFWEVTVKAAKAKLVLSLDAPIWLTRAERAPGIVYLPLDRTILLQSAHLSADLHGDPADRMLIAAAQLHATPLVTADENIIAFAATRRGVPVCDARG